MRIFYEDSRRLIIGFEPRRLRHLGAAAAGEQAGQGGLKRVYNKVWGRGVFKCLNRGFTSD